MQRYDHKNFCSNCGQKKFKRIDKKYILDDIQYTFLHANKGLFYSSKKIFLNPGKTAREFIDGKRVNHYKPILLTFLLSGISTFLSYKVLGMKEVMEAYYASQKLSTKATEDIMTFLTSYTSLIIILFIPFFALTTKIAFRKWGHNYYEHIVMNSYFLSYYTLISIVFVYPIMYFVKKSSPSTFLLITQLSMLLVPFLLVWFFKEFYKDRTLKSIIIKVLAIVGLTILGFLLLMILIIIIGVIFAMLKGPEGLQHLKAK